MLKPIFAKFFSWYWLCGPCKKKTGKKVRFVRDGSYMRCPICGANSRAL